MLERIGFLLLLAGLMIAASGYVWLLCRTFQASEVWGTIIFFVPPLTILYVLLSPRRALAPFLVIVLGAAVVVSPYGLRYYETHVVLNERVRDVDGERHVTLTGWDRTDYSLLASLPDTVVLQMANSDVTDETLTHLKSMKGLRELDLNDSQVTDAGLKVLRDLPKLQLLRLRNTKITDEGFQESIAPMPSLLKVELTGTPVKGAALRAWKREKSGREYLN
jgi:hypothetical protein